ncbi:hypothetical protein AVEN_23236-1 [Araneus ventricosus]|uniref:Uncharacterized protein n=1 Tax=Araneus ventricosus TaxID=182803 RepID=A0A4Y2T7Z3_ARAVE|nr:hypothetical protein AVEN_23236-1 [Araneus ventricosus]
MKGRRGLDVRQSAASREPSFGFTSIRSKRAPLASFIYSSKGRHGLDVVQSASSIRSKRDPFLIIYTSEGREDAVWTLDSRRLLKTLR